MNNGTESSSPSHHTAPHRWTGCVPPGTHTQSMSHRRPRTPPTHRRSCLEALQYLNPIEIQSPPIQNQPVTPKSHLSVSFLHNLSAEKEIPQERKKLKANLQSRDTLFFYRSHVSMSKKSFRTDNHHTRCLSSTNRLKSLNRGSLHCWTPPSGRGAVKKSPSGTDLFSLPGALFFKIFPSPSALVCLWMI